jgi:selenide, water dikinase
MGPEALAQVLRPLQAVFGSIEYPDLLSPLDLASDAALYRIADDRVMIQSIDFFPPFVDDPYLYGAISAANAMSDIYAVGGEVVLALSMAAFPANLPTDYLAEITRGAAEKVREANAVIVGGHTIIDPIPKYGLCVTGFAHPDELHTKVGARAGDALVLTKPLGIGALMSAEKLFKASPDHVAQALSEMARLNRGASRVLHEFGDAVHAVTDITGFGIIGHATEMAEQSGVQLHIDMEALPFVDGAMDCAQQGIHCSATARNRAYFGATVMMNGCMDHWKASLVYGSESSGGLLAAVDSERLDDLQRAMRAVDEACWTIGSVMPGQGIAFN